MSMADLKRCQWRHGSLSSILQGEGERTEPAGGRQGTASPTDRPRTMRAATIDGIRAARAVVAEHLPRTPTHSYPGLCELTGTTLWVKHENHHAVGAFKVR